MEKHELQTWRPKLLISSVDLDAWRCKCGCLVVFVWEGFTASLTQIAAGKRLMKSWSFSEWRMGVVGEGVGCGRRKWKKGQAIFVRGCCFDGISRENEKQSGNMSRRSRWLGVLRRLLKGNDQKVNKDYLENWMLGPSITPSNLSQCLLILFCVKFINNPNFEVQNCTPFLSSNFIIWSSISLTIFPKFDVQFPRRKGPHHFLQVPNTI